MRHTRGQRVTLEAVASVQNLRRNNRGCCTTAPRRESRLQLLREVEPIGGQAQRVLSLRRVLELRQNLAHAHERFLPVARALDLEPHTVDEIALGPAEQRSA